MTEKAVTWQTVRGTLLHRCVLHCANKWYPLTDKERRSEFVAQSRWMADHLLMALKYENFGQAAALADAGGPYWSDVIDDYRSLGPRGEVQGHQGAARSFDEGGTRAHAQGSRG